MPWRRLATWGMVTFMVLNAVALASYFILRGQIRKATTPAAAVAGEKFPVFSGMDLAGAEWRSRDSPCRVIRVTDDRCTYCKKDKPAYAAFLDAARTASCEIVEVAPKAGGMALDPRPGVVQLKFVDADIGAVMFPFATPHTVILDRSWTLRWTRRGVFNADSLAQGIATIKRLEADSGASKADNIAAK